MNKRCAQNGVCWATCIFLFLAQNIIATSARAGEHLEKLPVNITIQCSGSGDIVLEVSNPDDKEQRLTSNLAPILDSLFGGFPTRGALQCRNAKGEPISLHGQHDDGWWYPSVLSSSLDLPKDQKMETMSDITVPGKSAKKFPLNCGMVLRSAASHVSGGNNQTIEEFRIKLPFAAVTKSGEKTNMSVTSEWFPARSVEPDWTAVIPKIDLSEAPLKEYAPYLERLLRMHVRDDVQLTIVEDPSSLPNFKRQVVPKPDPEPQSLGERRIVGIAMTNFPAVEVLRFVAIQVNAEFLLQGACAFLYTGGTVEPLITDEYAVGESYAEGQTDLREELAKMGVKFYEGGYAIRHKQKAVVHTTEEQHLEIRARVD